MHNCWYATACFAVVLVFYCGNDQQEPPRVVVIDTATTVYNSIAAWLRDVLRLLFGMCLAFCLLRVVCYCRRRRHCVCHFVSVLCSVLLISFVYV